jgi:hypothetical protein
LFRCDEEVGVRPCEFILAHSEGPVTMHLPNQIKNTLQCLQRVFR